MNISNGKWVVIAVVVSVAALGGVALWQTGMLGGDKAKPDSASHRYPPPEPLVENNLAVGIKLSKEAIESLELMPKEIEASRSMIPLPPMIGTINYDNERLFSIKPRFPGEIAELKTFDEIREFTVDGGSTTYKTCQRPLKFGDKVKQGEILAVVWSQALGVQKAAFVDAISNLRLSQDTLDRQNELFKKGVVSETALKQAENKVQTDHNALLTAERSLRIWKMNDDEIKMLRAEAENIIDQKAKRDVQDEVRRWARVEVTVPWFSKDPKNLKDPGDPKRELTVLEKNTHLGDMVDPANYGMPLFRIADMSRLQIWVHPPEEYLPLIRERLKAGRGVLKWEIRFQADSAKTPPQFLDVEQISPSLNPDLHTPMLIGYLNNTESKHLVGQFVTATIMIPPPPDTVELPTSAINPLNGQEFVFVEKPGTTDQFLIRRVSVVQSFRKSSYVRTKLTPEQEKANLQVGADGFKIESLQPGERVATRGVVELTAALEDLRNTQKKDK